MTDTEINEAVARKLGWTDLFLSKNIGVMDIAGKRNPNDTMNSTVPVYCHSIEAAWEIVQKMGHIQMALDYRKKWCVGIGWEDEWDLLAEADTAPMAICLAFLKLP